MISIKIEQEAGQVKAFIDGKEVSVSEAFSALDASRTSTPGWSANVTRMDWRWATFEEWLADYKSKACLKVVGETLEADLRAAFDGAREWIPAKPAIYSNELPGGDEAFIRQGQEVQRLTLRHGYRACLICCQQIEVREGRFVQHSQYGFACPGSGDLSP